MDQFKGAKWKHLAEWLTKGHLHIILYEQKGNTLRKITDVGIGGTDDPSRKVYILSRAVLEVINDSLEVLSSYVEEHSTSTSHKI